MCGGRMEEMIRNGKLLFKRKIKIMIGNEIIEISRMDLVSSQRGVVDNLYFNFSFDRGYLVIVSIATKTPIATMSTDSEASHWCYKGF